jgi:hypothetical protein
VQKSVFVDKRGRNWAPGAEEPNAPQFLAHLSQMGSLSVLLFLWEISHLRSKTMAAALNQPLAL